MRVNNHGTADVRGIFSGKDAALYDEDGTHLATVTQFQGQINTNNATYNPLGSAQTYKHLLTYEITLTIQETIIESSKFIKDMYDWLMNGYPVWWTFKSTIFGWNGSNETIIFRDCVPDGQLDLHNFNTGELWVRSWTLHCNAQPEMQQRLSRLIGG